MVRFGELLSSIIVLGSTLSALAQTPPGGALEPSRLLYSPRDKTLEVTTGALFPFSHAGLKSFWMRGPALDMYFMFRATEQVRFGIGANAALLSFRQGAFAQAFPGVPLQTKDLGAFHIYLGIRGYSRPGLRMTPFFGFQVGVMRLTGAEYKAIIDGVRKTYYEIPGTAHLTTSVSAGVDYYISRRVAVQCDSRLTYVLKDPDAGLQLVFLAGFKFSL